MTNCPNCKAALEPQPAPIVGFTGVRASRFIECATCGTRVHLCAINGDAEWTALSWRPEIGGEWRRLPDADAFYARVEARVK